MEEVLILQVRHFVYEGVQMCRKFSFRHVECIVYSKTSVQIKRNLYMLSVLKC